VAMIVAFPHQQALCRLKLARCAPRGVQQDECFVGDLVQLPVTCRLDKRRPVVDGDGSATLHRASVLSRNPNDAAKTGRATERGEDCIERHGADSTFCTIERQGETYSTKTYCGHMPQRVPAGVPRLDEPDERLVWARERAGYKTATDAARRFHWNENTYRSHENGQRGISKKAAAKYARAFKMPVEWLLFGEGAMIAPVDPELISLWDNLTDVQRRDLLRYGKMLVKEVA
jgi:DNA-binding XRE family transcriptional regulator